MALGAQIVELYVESERKVEPSEPLWIAAQFQDQIGNHGKIDHQGDAFANAEVFDEFIDFEREQRSSRNDGEIFSPALAQCQANAFGEKNGGINKRAYAEFLAIFSAHDCISRSRHTPAAGGERGTSFWAR